MIVRITKECECRHTFWHDTHWGDRWKDDNWVEMTRKETLNEGQMIHAFRIRPSTKRPGCCRISVSLGEEPESYFRVPWECIEILEDEPAKTKKKR
jgi:hypothetical protein